MIKKVLNLVRKISLIELAIRSLADKSLSKNDMYIASNIQAKILIDNNNNKKSILSLSDVEFKVFSQFGDDGIIQYIIDKIEFESKTFIEFGVETYQESNTRFLAINNNWSGMVIDGSEKNINFINSDSISFFSELYTKKAFITKENINELLQEFTYYKNLDILSIDIDGNDYWVWKEINVVNPIMVIVEYNSVFGDENPWVMPYNSTHIRELHTENVLLYGTSLLSLCDLAEEKGYYFIGCNSAGNNSYFIRKDKIGSLKPLSCKEGFVLSKFSEYYDSKSSRRIRGKERLDVLQGKTIFDTRKNTIVTI